MLDPIRRGKKVVEEKGRPQSRSQKRKIQVVEPEKKFSLVKKIFLILLALIIIFIFFGGGFFLFELTKAKEESITENFSGGAPALTDDSHYLPVPGESDKEFDLINILLLGNGGAGHPGGALADVIQILSINVKTNKALIVSLPRDLFVEIDGSKHKINEMYFRGEAKGKGRGGDQSKKITGEILGIPIHYYLKVDFSGFKEIVDALGGVDVYVDKGISDNVWGYKISAGPRHFNGKEALNYVRSRYSTSDFDRSSRQQKVLLAMRDKALSIDLIKNPDNIKKIIEATSRNLRTDITFEEMIKIFFVAREIPGQNVENFVIDNGASGLLYSTMSRGGAYILLPVGGDYNKVQEMVKTKLP